MWLLSLIYVLYGIQLCLMVSNSSMPVKMIKGNVIQVSLMGQLQGIYMYHLLQAAFI